MPKTNDFLKEGYDVDITEDTIKGQVTSDKTVEIYIPAEEFLEIMEEFKKLHKRIDSMEETAKRMEIKADKLANMVRGVMDKVM